MPRELPDPKKPIKFVDTDNKGSGAVIPVHRIPADYTDLKIKNLAETVARTYVPYDLANTEKIEDVTVDGLENNSYLYIDNDGKPSKILAVTVLRKEIDWEDLSEEAKAKIIETIKEETVDSLDGASIENGPNGIQIKGFDTAPGTTMPVYIDPQTGIKWQHAVSTYELEQKVLEAAGYASQAKDAEQVASRKAEVATAAANKAEAEAEIIQEAIEKKFAAVTASDFDDPSFVVTPGTFYFVYDDNNRVDND